MNVARPLKITEDSSLYQDALLDDSWLLEAKLDGDRVIYEQGIEQNYSIYNRHGEKFKHADINLKIIPWTIVDGEYYKGKFYAFDCMQYGGLSIMDKPLYYRKQILNDLNILTMPAIYEKDDPLKEAEKNGWEGLVLKNLEHPYPTKDGVQWLKVTVK